jgi:uncharacterized protein
VKSGNGSVEFRLTLARRASTMSRMSLSRRSFLAASAAALTVPLLAPARDDQPRWLLFTKSSGFEHDLIKQRQGESTTLYRAIAPVFADRKLTLDESKDGRLFDEPAIDAYAGFVFYTTGDLTSEGKDRNPAMSKTGKKNLLDAIASGKPFVGLHCASDTFRTTVDPQTKQPVIDDYIRMLGGEFSSHGDQQKAAARVVDQTFPGAGEDANWETHEEWYAMTNLAATIKPVLELQTKGMKGVMYQRDPYPIAWTHQWGEGRVFYNAMGHRGDVVESKRFLDLLGGAIDWCRAK